MSWVRIVTYILRFHVVDCGFSVREGMKTVSVVGVPTNVLQYVYFDGCSSALSWSRMEDFKTKSLCSIVPRKYSAVAST